MPLFRPTTCEIDLSALRHNYRQLKERAGTQEILAVVKANAYGHGALTVARALVHEGASLLGVATVEEGIELRRSGISCPILCLGGPLGASAADLLEYGLTPVVFNEEGILSLTRQVHEHETRLGIHLKVDTGMGRLGIFPEELPAILQLIREYPVLELKGVMTHLACADDANHKPTLEQSEKFKTVEQEVKKAGFEIPVFHLANSAALIDGMLGDTALVRPGLALYGAYPDPRLKEKIDLKPVLTWKTQIISLKQFPRKSPISYGATYKTSRPSLIAVMAVGYADGYSRFFSNKGEVLVKGRRAPVVGRVCMDLTMIDVTDIPNVEVGNEVILIGHQNGESLSAEELAKKIGTISYEIFCGISARVPRIAVSGGEVV